MPRSAIGGKCEIIVGKNKYFFIAMDNYFTLQKATEMLREFMIEVVGTARFRPGWPGQNSK